MFVMPAQLILPHTFYQAIVAHARADFPNEACGLLRGRDGCVSDILPARNVAPNPRQDYQADAQSLLQALRWEDEGDELVGIYHCHPTSPAYPSAVDAARAFYPDSVYLIISLQEPGAPQMNGYLLRPEVVLRGDAARSLQLDIPFEQVRPGLWAYHLPAGAPLLDRFPDAPSDDVAFYLVFEDNSGHKQPQVRLISVLPAPLTIQL
jgi:proteasome lid subunit RPN8/RPN11